MILNLTQHEATPAQAAAGVTDLPPKARRELIDLLTLNEVPRAGDLEGRSAGICHLARMAFPPGVERFVMAGSGHPAFVPILERDLQFCGLQVIYAFSRRVVEELSDDTVEKKATFRHEGFIPAGGAR